jgi:hypothetical protein
MDGKTRAPRAHEFACKTGEGSLCACRVASAYHQPWEKDGRDASFYF